MFNSTFRRLCVQSGKIRSGLVECCPRLRGLLLWLAGPCDPHLGGDAGPHEGGALGLCSPCAPPVQQSQGYAYTLPNHLRSCLAMGGRKGNVLHVFSLLLEFLEPCPISSDQRGHWNRCYPGCGRDESGSTVSCWCVSRTSLCPALC